jgi:rSAM/selenodomain-associated transferase 1
MKALVIAKEPLPGRVKTRLCPPCSPDDAAAIAEASLADTLATVVAAGFDEVVVVLDGRPGPWLPTGVGVVPQRGAGLEERLAAAFDDVGGPAVLVGMDTPQLTAGDLGRAATALEADRTDAVLGPAVDGGWWAIGLRRADARVFLGVPMSAPITGSAQLARLRGLGLRVRALPMVRDVDTFADAQVVARLAPEGRFAAVVDDVTSRLGVEVPA